MAVLTDIRSLLSASRDTIAINPADTKPETTPSKGKEANRKELQQYQEMIQAQQARIACLEGEKQELSAKLATLSSNMTKAPQDQEQLKMEIAGLAASKDELSRALAEIEGLLQLKLKDLVRRIGRVYEEAGDFEAGRDFRHISNQLEAAENFGEFIRALLRE